MAKSGPNTLLNYFAKASTSAETDAETATEGQGEDAESDVESHADSPAESPAESGVNEEGMSSAEPPSAKRKRIYIYRFQESWKEERPWLRHVKGSDSESMVCDTCIQFGKAGNKSTFIPGCTTMKISSVTTHEGSDAHAAAVKRKAMSELPRQVVETGTGDSKPKAKGLLKTLKSLKFVMFMQFVLYVFKYLAPLSACFQQRDVTLEMVKTKVSTVQLKLQELSRDRAKMKKKMKDGVEEDDEGVKYKTVRLTRGQAREDGVVEEAVQVLSTIDYHLDGRFKDTFLNNDVINSALAFDPSTWPPTAEALASYGEEEISTIFQHYKVPLEKAGHSLDNCLIQWGELKVVVRRKLSFGPMKFLDVWQHVIQEHSQSDRFNDILALAKIILLLPVSTAECERGFSLMKRVKSDWRNRLRADTLTGLMDITLSDQQVETFSPTDAMARWWADGKTTRRPRTTPYGRRRRDPEQAQAADYTSSESETDSEDL
ncbi:ZNF862 [Branchiostoma lanceolatum]|uniref:ZNF862 protein n=1 Tax=Branchiostoma lanceolatum TaxID=7740 RepID=A0A8K0ELG6_BRALA|nr:ZNF862 [Branchiostoma lanceolatum]